MIKVKTESIQKMLNKAVKVCSLDKFSPLTILTEVKIEGGYLSITTTDTRTTFQIKEKVETADEMRVVVDVQLLTSLVNKITTPEIGFDMNGNALVIEGNGLYYLDIGIDESGEVIKFPEIKEPAGNGTEIDFKELTRRLEIAKSSIPASFDAKEMNNYYLAAQIIASDAFKVSSVPNIESLKAKELFISRELGNILMSLGIEKGKLDYVSETNILTIFDNDYIIQSVIGQDRENYPLEAIQSMLSSSFTYNADISKKELLDILDRALLFIKDFDRNGINLTFKKDRLSIASVEETVQEDIKYSKASVDGLVEFNALVDIKNLKEQLDVLPDDNITIFFGDNDRAIKMVQKDIIQITALLED